LISKFFLGELEKCLGELEEKHDTTNKLAEVFDKVESERNQLLNELDIAFQDLQEYMQKQVSLRCKMRCYDDAITFVKFIDI